MGARLLPISNLSLSYLWFYFVSSFLLHVCHESIVGTGGKEPTYQCRRHKRCRFDSLGREDFPWVGRGNPLQYSCLENPIDKGAQRATIHSVTSSRTQYEETQVAHMSLYYFSRLMSPMSVQEAFLYAPKEMWYMYAIEYHSHQKNKRNAICHNMDGPRDWQPE